MTQTISVNIMPDKTTTCWVFCFARFSSLLKKFIIDLSTEPVSVGMRLLVKTLYNVRALSTWRGPEQNITRIQAIIQLATCQVRCFLCILLTLEAEVREECDVLSALLRFGELCEDQEAPPALPTPADTLQAHSQVVQERLSYAASVHDAPGADVLIGQVDEREYDTDREHNFNDIEGDKRRGLDLTGPLVESQQVDCGKAVDAIDGHGKKK